MGKAIASAASKLQSKLAGKATSTVKATGKVAKPTTASKPQAAQFDLKLGAIVWNAWVKGRLFVALGIREKTATGLQVRSAMLAVAAYGYPQGQGMAMARSVLAYRATLKGDADRKCNPHVGGIDFPWLEKAGNVSTITASAAIRPDRKDGKMRLLPIVATRKAPTVKAEVKAASERIKARKATGERVNGPVTVTRMSDAELAALQDGAGNGNA